MGLQSVAFADQGGIPNANSNGHGNGHGSDSEGGGGDDGSSSSDSAQVTLTASLPSVVMVKVNPGTSTLSALVNPSLIDSSSNVSSSDFRVQGNIVVNNPSSQVQCTVSSTSLSLSNGSDTITVRINGTIGGVTISERAFTPTFSSRQATINLTGDLDESTVTSTKSPGSYRGTFTITASLL